MELEYSGFHIRQIEGSFSVAYYGGTSVNAVKECDVYYRMFTYKAEDMLE